MSLAKKILSTFIEVSDDDNTVAKNQEPVRQAQPVRMTPPTPDTNYTGINSDKFKAYFTRLFQESNFPGPDYYEFSKMIEALQSLPDERQRYTAAFAGLSAQGLDKAKLLQTADQYLEILDQDAKNFNATVDTALNDKVEGKKHELSQNAKKIEELTREINNLNNKNNQLNTEIAENEEKIKNSTGGYLNEMTVMKQRIIKETEKIKNYL